MSSLEVSSTPGSAHAQLARLLRDQAIVVATADRPIVGRDGKPLASWALYTWAITSTKHGMELAARSLLDRLSTFRSTQLAGLGYTALPLLTSCVLLSDGRYTALCIRDKRKDHLTRNLIEGRPDKTKPVVVIDDSLSSGTSLRKAIQSLESEGFEVEGAVALVGFPYRGGAEWGYRAGYRVETVLDIWRDIRAPLGPAYARPAPPSPSGPPLPDGLNPAVAARMVAQSLLSSGGIPGAPGSLDRNIDGRGGVFVSFRSIATEQRFARDGFWHFDPDMADPCRDLVHATVRTILSSGGTITAGSLPGLKVAVTFLGPLERIKPSGLDFDRYGIVIRDTLTQRKLGGALPNTQYFVSEIEQYTHARLRNAKVARNEPHELFRHEIRKVVEPGHRWLPYGKEDGPEMAWAGDGVGRSLTDFARCELGRLTRGSSPQEEHPSLPPIPCPIEGAAVSVYNAGLRASGIAYGSASVEALVREASRRAASSLNGAYGSFEHPAVCVTLLHDPERFPPGETKLVQQKLRRGLDALRLIGSRGEATLLPGGMVYNNWNGELAVAHLREVVSRGAGNGALQATTYRATSWLSDCRGVRRLRFGFSARPRSVSSASGYEGQVQLMGGFIAAGMGDDNLPTYVLDTIQGRRTPNGTSARLMHGLSALHWAGRILGRNDWTEMAHLGLRGCLNQIGKGGAPGAVHLANHHNGTMGDAVLLKAVADAGEPLLGHPAVPALAAGITSCFRPDGRICARPVRLDRAQDHDFLPGAVLLAWSSYRSALGKGLDAATLQPYLKWHRARFRLLESWGMAGWQPQGWAAAHRLTADQEQAELCFEVADWAVDRQLEKNGAFLEDLSPAEPSFNTGFIAEGIAAAWSVARATGDAGRQRRYEASWRGAMDFLRTLTIHRDDTFALAAPDAALGGVRTTLTRSDVRIDGVSHALHALCAGVELLRQA